MRSRKGVRDARLALVLVVSIFATGCAVSPPLRVGSETILRTAFLYLTWFRG
jgi:hypothetical protein